jgi:hypothetical protein
MDHRNEDVREILLHIVAACERALAQEALERRNRFGGCVGPTQTKPPTSQQIPKAPPKREANNA